MKPTALLLSVIVVASALFACVEPPPPVATSAPAASLAASPLCRDSDKFLNKVSVLKLPYWPNPNGGSYQPPQPNGTITNPNIREDLEQAFCSANQRVKNDLLSVKGVFINPCIEAKSSDCGSPNPKVCDPNNCVVPAPLDPQTVIANSWGFRDNYPNKYIATSAALWKIRDHELQHAPIFIDYKTMRLGALLNRVAAQNVPNIGRYVWADANTSAITVLAALAHEFGHAYWYDAFVPSPGGPADFTKFCGGRFYLGAGRKGTWAMPITFSQRWIDFADIRNSHQSDDVNISDLKSYLRSGAPDKAGNVLHRVLSGNQPNGQPNRHGGPWASPLAALSPDEDFVESYQLYALTQATPKLTTLQINIPGTGTQVYLDDIPGHLDVKRELKRKMRCFDRNAVLP